MNSSLLVLLLGVFACRGALAGGCNREWYDDTDHGHDSSGYDDGNDVTSGRGGEDGNCQSELEDCNVQLRGVAQSEAEVLKLSLQKGRLEGRLRDVECKVAASKERQKKLTDQIIALVAKKNEAQAKNIRLSQVKDRDACTLQQFDETAGNCIKQAALANLTRLGEGIYYFYNDFANVKTAQESFLYCTNYGMKLVELETEEENNLIKAKAAELLALDPPTLPGVDPADIMEGKWFYIALNDILTEGVFSWPSQSPIPAAYTDWLTAVNAPNGGTAENGVVLGQYQTPGNIFWDDVPISRKGRFICEMLPQCLPFFKNVV